MRSKDLILFLVMQLVAFVTAGASFALIADRWVAGLIASSVFLLTGLWMFYLAWRWPARWRSLCWYPLLVHLFVITIPLIVTRQVQPSIPFDQLFVLGIPGPIFHRLSETVFALLVLLTVIDLWRLRRQMN